MTDGFLETQSTVYVARFVSAEGIGIPEGELSDLVLPHLEIRSPEQPFSGLHLDDDCTPHCETMHPEIETTNTNSAPPRVASIE